MTPAINLVKKQKIPHKLHEYSHDTAHPCYGAEAAEKLGLAESQVFKTLVVNLDGAELVVAVVPVSAMLSMKLIAKALAGKKASMASKEAVERATGYVLGGVSPLGQKKSLRTIVDVSARQLTSMFVSAGRRGLELELKPQDLLSLVGGQFAAICQA